jgi:hypothetical protein
MSPVGHRAHGPKVKREAIPGLPFRVVVVKFYC